VKYKSAELSEVNTEENLWDPWFDTKSMIHERTIPKWYFIKIKRICSVNVKRRKRPNTDQENIFAKHIADRGLVSKV
jgi:hypothetical protein